MISNIRYLLLILLLGQGDNLFSQQLTQQVLVPVAGVTSISSVVFSQTIGEAAVELVSSSDFILTQGFQQPGVKFVWQPTHEGNGFNVYPNPATERITIKLFGDIPRDFTIDIINISGLKVYAEKLTFTDKFYIEKEISLSNFTFGVYFVRIISGDKEINRTFIFEKM
jgi:hypothetical protein